MKNLLYVGGFELPDRNAAAQRVIAVAQGLRELGHRVTFLNYTGEASGTEWVQYAGFDCLQAPARGMLRHLTDISDVKRIAQERQIDGIIAYNYPAAALWQLIRWCRRRKIRCYADATEWYAAQGNPLFRLVKTLDTEWRMRVLQGKMDGVIAISDYLYRYYRDRVPTVKIPPLVDMDAPKWRAEPADRPADRTVFIYSGTPSAQKERLDLILDAAQQARGEYPPLVRIIGIDRTQYETMYGRKAPEGCAEFLGRVSHGEAIRQVRAADWAVIIRDNNRVVQAGFPTKLVESLSCGTPVIANRFSNIEEYMTPDCGILCTQEELAGAIEAACARRFRTAQSPFDYHGYLQQLQQLFS